MPRPLTAWNPQHGRGRRAGALGILAKLNETANDAEIDKIVKFALPLQQAHVDAVREQSLRLAAKEDPTEPSINPMAPLGDRRSPPDAEPSKLPREQKPSVDDHDRVVGDELALGHNSAGGGLVERAPDDAPIARGQRDQHLLHQRGDIVCAFEVPRGRVSTERR
jgi:hypothetical protein